MQKTRLLVALIAAASSSYAYLPPAFHSAEGPSSCCDLPCPAHAPENCAYLPSARSCTPTSFYGSIDFLYWEGTERGLDYALKNTQSTNNQDVTVLQPDFGFEPAFRVSAGFQLPIDHWDLEAVYIYYAHRTKNQAHVDFASAPVGAGLQAVWNSSTAFNQDNNGVLWQEAEAKWKLHSHIVDLFLANSLCMSTTLAIEPAFGLKLALLQQRFAVEYEAGNTVGLRPTLTALNSSISMNNRSLNVGPMAGLTTRWNFVENFNVVGAVSGALLASRFHVGRHESNAYLLSGAPTFEFFRESNIFWTLRPQATVSLGVTWSTCYCRPCNKNAIEFGLGAFYEAQVWWKQNMLYRALQNGNFAVVSPTQGNLYFHGLTLDAIVRF